MSHATDTLCSSLAAWSRRQLPFSWSCKRCCRCSHRSGRCSGHPQTRTATLCRELGLPGACDLAHPSVLSLHDADLTRHSFGDMAVVRGLPCSLLFSEVTECGICS